MDETWDPRIAECSNEQLSVLLSLAVKPERPAGSPSSPTPDGEAIREALRAMSPGGSSGAASFLDELLDDGTPIARIQEIKRAAKQRYATARESRARGAATLLYHLSIAAAYVRHGVVISSRPIASRSGLYEDLAAALGPVPLGLLFRQAAERIADAAPGP